MSDSIKRWSLWIVINLLIVAYFSYALIAPASTIKTALLPGKTTHGHYQIELNCDACHHSGRSEHSNANVMQDSCVRCHGEQLESVRDTHPAKKFNDPTHAELLLTLNAKDCLSCHREHVPEQTLPMGLTIPSDYCWHCHQNVAENRPSHAGLTYDSCATAGCHNYHDNRALYEKFLDQHFGEPDFLQSAVNPPRTLASDWAETNPTLTSLRATDLDAPAASTADATLTRDWAETAHAAAGVDCRGCHAHGDSNGWNDAVAMETCGHCHQRQAESFVSGRHAMRIGQSMSPMKPSMARLPMHAGAAHRELTCNSCHRGHRFDTRFAAVEACQQCHADAHTIAYGDSSHAQLWRQELAGELPAGSGVSCATCHLPRLSDRDITWVNHDQNANLRPNETMAREVCGNCHGLEFSLSALADPALADSCYDQPPARRIESVNMARQWFEQKQRKRERRAESTP